MIQCSNRCKTNVFGTLLNYQSHIFWDTGQLMGPWQSHTGRMEVKDRCEGKLFGRPETTSSLACAYGTNLHLFFLAAPMSPAARAISSHVGSKSRLVDSIGPMKFYSISSGALLAIISSGAFVYQFQRKIIHAPEFRMQVLQDINASVHPLKRHSIVGLHSYYSTRRNGS